MRALTPFLLASLTLVLAAPAFAADGVASRAIVDCRNHDAALEDQDRALEAKTRSLMMAHDMTALIVLKPALKMALSHAPDVPSHPERCGDSIVLYSDGLTDLLTMTAVVTQDPALQNVSVEQRKALPYAALAFDLGWIYFEGKDYVEATTWYRQGLQNDPDDLDLTSELAIALSYTGRHEENLALVDAYLASHDLNGKDKARLLRKRAWAFVEMGRLDDGEAAYRQSLELEPGNELAEQELKYIAGLRTSKTPN